MATNPMQRQKRIAGLTGAVITLLITGAIIAFLVMQLANMKKAEKEAIERKTTVMVLTSDVQSGQLITTIDGNQLFAEKEIDSALVPKDAISTARDLRRYNLQTTDGKQVICKIEDNKPKYYIQENGNDIQIEEKDGKYYKKENNQDKEVVLNNVPLVAKVDMKANTVLTGSLLSQSDELITSDVREQEYNMLSIQSGIQDEDVVDIRLRTPKGQDYIVISKKTVIIPEQGGTVDSDTIKLKLTEDEILTMSSAIVDSYMMQGSVLYVSKYVEPGTQESAIPTYSPNQDIINLINNDPNITQRAMIAISQRYNRKDRNDTDKTVMSTERNKIDSIINSIDESTRNSNVQSKSEESVTKTKELRKRFYEQAAATAAE